VAATVYEDVDTPFKTATDWLIALQAQSWIVRVSYVDWTLNIDTVYDLNPAQVEWLTKLQNGKIKEVNVDITSPENWETLNSDTFDNIEDAIRFIKKNFAGKEGL
jgi:hypothetical protein